MDGWHRAFVLHRRNYSETSLLVDLFSEQEGKICVLAKGARRPRSKLKGCLQPFTPLLIRWSGQGAVKTLRDVEAISLTLPLTAKHLYSGLYLNELLMRVLEQGTAYPALFLDYLRSLHQLASQPQSEPTLRYFELALLEQLGYGIDFLHCAGSGQPIEREMTYRYRAQQGFIASMINDSLTFSGNQLMALAKRQFNDEESLRAAKRFTRMALKPYLGSAPLKSRELFRQFISN